MRGIRKLAGSLYKRLARPLTHRYDVYHRKNRLWLLDRDSMMDEGLIKFKEYEDELIDNARRLIEEYRITHLFDIGANLGYYTVQLGKLPQIREIHSFEPFPALYLQIGANVLINGLTEKWHGHRCALSDREGMMALHYHPFYLGTSSLDPEWTERATEHIEVPVRRMDACVQQSGARCYAKVDVEGSEVGVLKGMRGFLEKNLVVLQIEAIEAHLDQITSLLQESGLEHLASKGTDHFFASAITS